MTEMEPVAYWPDLKHGDDNTIWRCREALERFDECGADEDGVCEWSGTCYRLEARKKADPSSIMNGRRVPFRTTVGSGVGSESGAGAGMPVRHAICYATMSDLWEARGGEHSMDKAFGETHDDITDFSLSDFGPWLVNAVWTTGDVYAYREDHMRLGSTLPAVLLLGRIGTYEMGEPFGPDPFGPDLPGQYRSGDEPSGRGLLWYALRCDDCQRPAGWKPLREDC